jgi:hypothetical protein
MRPARRKKSETGKGLAPVKAMTKREIASDRVAMSRQACAGGCEKPRPLAIVPERITIGSNRDALQIL